MKNILRVLSGSLLLSLVACGTAPSALNNADLNASAGVEANAADEGSELGLSGDSCKVNATIQTFTLAQGGSLEIDYEFLKLSAGDRVKVLKADSDVVVYDSRESIGQLSTKIGKILIPVSNLGTGRFKVKGYVNSNANYQDPQADCSLGSNVVIREK